MARKRNSQTEPNVVEHNPQPVQSMPEVSEPPEHFKKLKTVVHKPNWRGRVSIYNPLYVPPGVRVSFRLAPSGPHSGADFASAKLEGWDPLPPEFATTDLDEAMAAQKVALLHYDVVDGLVRVGEHVVMYMLENDWYRKYYDDLRALSEMTKPPTINVLEDRSEELVASTKKGDV